MLIFPSRGPESLSRVLIEASALGVPIAAMNTGGTPDIIAHEVTGLLSKDAGGARGRRPAAAAGRGAAAAARRGSRLRMGERFDAAAAVGRIEELYRELTGKRAA